mmetsp:Transcript_81231/g.178535  ORF Transcript_81231/g.178535 Transcript_81231/m.178535 type:complete len:267 (-) Transcript_81231:33-833(-)
MLPHTSLSSGPTNANGANPSHSTKWQGELATEDWRSHLRTSLEEALKPIRITIQGLDQRLLRLEGLPHPDSRSKSSTSVTGAALLAAEVRWSSLQERLEALEQRIAYTAPTQPVIDPGFAEQIQRHLDMRVAAQLDKFQNDLEELRGRMAAQEPQLQWLRGSLQTREESLRAAVEKMGGLEVGNRLEGLRQSVQELLHQRLEQDEKLSLFERRLERQEEAQEEIKDAFCSKPLPEAAWSGRLEKVPEFRPLSSPPRPSSGPSSPYR